MVRLFQSLFWWNVLLNYIFGSSPCKGSRVSILVLVECTSESHRLVDVDVVIRRFNPCSGGMYFWIVDVALRHAWIGKVSILVLVECTSEYNARQIMLSKRNVVPGTVQILLKFQSLFWWNVLLNCLSINIIDGLRVSILVLVECTSESKCDGCSTSIPSGFQSLFWWNVLLNLGFDSIHDQ